MGGGHIVGFVICATIAQISLMVGGLTPAIAAGAAFALLCLGVAADAICEAIKERK
jgi:hypothetical protein